MTGIQNLLDSLEQMRDECAATMQGHLGGATMCQIHKDGRVSGGLKYEEGRLAVLGAIIRQVKKMADLTGVEALLASEHAQWQTALQCHQTRQPPSMPWVAYSQGGLDVVETIQRVWSAAD